MKDAKLRVKNVGRGTAYSVYADVMFDDVKIDSGEIDQNWREKIKNHRPISQKTLPPGESLPFTDFDFPLVHTTNPQGLKGKIGFICKDEDGKDVFDLQDFIIIVHLEADRPHAHFDFKTPFRTTGQVHRTPKELEAFLESQRVSEKGK